MQRELRTVCDANGIAVLEIVREGDNLTIYEADDMDREIRFPLALVPILLEHLQHYKQKPSV